jgi:hypothetical protein
MDGFSSSLVSVNCRLNLCGIVSHSISDSAEVFNANDFAELCLDSASRRSGSCLDESDKRRTRRISQTR